MWKLAVFLTSVAVLVPLLTLAIIDYRVTRDAMENELVLRTSRLASNTRRTVTYYLRERRSALEFIARDNTYMELNEPHRMEDLLESLKESFGGFVDLGVIDPLGNQRTYVGPYDLEGRNYGDQGWFNAVAERGLYISDVFMGFREVPHMVIAVKRILPNGSFFVLRATLDTERFQEILSKVEVSPSGEACLINRDGIVQSKGVYHGEVLEKSRLPVPEYAPHTRVIEETSEDGKRLLVGYAYIEETPFILTIVKPKRELMEPWYQTRDQIIGFLVVSVAVILVVILGGATYLVNRIYQADQRRLTALHQLEYSNKMATIGRLSAGVAHEINNPLAIINEKAGLIRDYFMIKKEYAHDKKLLSLLDIIIKSVDRCSTITRRLLSFARQTDVLKLG
ncbi:MAG: cache domain-containing protein [Desulfobacteraceae bacterium]